MVHSKLRGNDIELIDGEWVYSDTKEATAFTFKGRPCGNCNEQNTIEDHDACLGTLPGLMNACCGHGEVNEVYIQLLDGVSIYGEDATLILNILKKYK